MVDDEDPSYEELLEENYELHEERKITAARLQSLERDLAEERSTGRDNARSAVEIERLQQVANHARACTRMIGYLLQSFNFDCATCVISTGTALFGKIALERLQTGGGYFSLFVQFVVFLQQFFIRWIFVVNHRGQGARQVC